MVPDFRRHNNRKRTSCDFRRGSNEKKERKSRPATNKGRLTECQLPRTLFVRVHLQIKGEIEGKRLLSISRCDYMPK